MSLPLAIVDQVFAKMAVTYGHAFLSRWDGMDLADVKDDWARELAPFAQAPGAIVWGLQHLPDRPPTVLEFRAICARRPSPTHIPLPGPRVAAAVIAKAAAALGPKPPKPEGRDLRWAHAIVAKQANGQHVSPAALRDAHIALRGRQLA